MYSQMIFKFVKFASPVSAIFKNQEGKRFMFLNILKSSRCATTSLIHNNKRFMMIRRLTKNERHKAYIFQN